MQTRRTSILAAVLVAGSLTVGIGASPAMASTIPTTIHSARRGLTPDPAPVRLATVDQQTVDQQTVDQQAVEPTGSPAPVPARDSRGAIPIGPIVSFIKSAGPSVWTACVKAVKAGSGAFAKWWSGLASWIRTGVLFIVDATVQQLYQWLLDWVTHH